MYYDRFHDRFFFNKINILNYDKAALASGDPAESSKSKFQPEK